MLVMVTRAHPEDGAGVGGGKDQEKARLNFSRKNIAPDVKYTVRS